MLPTLTHLQFLILGQLIGGDKYGRDLRATLASEGARKTPAAFYSLMARLEDAGLVDGWYRTEASQGVTIRERCYRVLGPGVAAWNETNQFYLERGSRGGHGEARA